VTVFASPFKNYDKGGDGAPCIALYILDQEHLLYLSACNFFSKSATNLVLMIVKKLLVLFTVAYQ
jgi:hypothetical protein